jgi:hypothetical protein
MWGSIIKQRSGAFASKSYMFQNSIMGTYSLANFAKFDRSKPHLNVGTIGKKLTISKLANSLTI